MRYQGKITEWNDDRGFGFITPNGGGPQVFIHISSLSRQGRRPAESDIVTYELTKNDKGQARARDVAFARVPGAAAVGPRNSPAALITACVFLGLLGIAVLAGTLPAVVPGFYLLASLATLLVYARDKSAARRHQWRTPESTLHLFSLAGGWPGALLAQRYLRHKSAKPAFQSVFRATVVINCAALIWLLSPYGQALLRAIRP